MGRRKRRGRGGACHCGRRTASFLLGRGEEGGLGGSNTWRGRGGRGGMVALGGARGGGGRRRSFPFTLLPFLLPLFFVVFCYLHQSLYRCLPSDYIMCPFDRNSKCIRDIDRGSRRLCFSFPRTASNQTQEKKVLKKKSLQLRSQKEAGRGPSRYMLPDFFLLLLAAVSNSPTTSNKETGKGLLQMLWI